MEEIRREIRSDKYCGPKLAGTTLEIYCAQYSQSKLRKPNNLSEQILKASHSTIKRKYNNKDLNCS